MTSDVATLTLEDTRSVRSALRKLDGRATVGDIASATGLVQSSAEAALRKLLEVHHGHLEVGERGDLVFRFDKKMLRRDAEPYWDRFREKAWAVFKAGFKIWIVVMLVVYFVIFVALMIAAIFANQNRDSNGGGLGGRRGGRSHGGGFGNFWIWYWLMSPGYGRRRRYYGESYVGGKDLGGGKKQGAPFYKKVFAFVFGPDRPAQTQERKDRDYLRIIRNRKGLISATELVQATGLGLDEADDELGRLMAAHDGNAEVTENGTIVYTFPSLMVSAHGKVEARTPPPAWRRLEPAIALTGNKATTNAMVGGLNAFNLAAAVTAPLFIFPRLGLGGPLAEIGLIWIPVVFSTIFFAIPAFRSFGLARENAKKAIRNVRRVALGLVSKASLESDQPRGVTQAEIDAAVESALGSAGKAKARSVLDRLVAEFDGEVDADASGQVTFRFPGFRQSVEAAHRARTDAKLELQDVGRIVYDSGDDAAEAGERALADFDEQLARELEGGQALPSGAGAAAASGADGPSNLAGYLDDPTRYAFRDEFELAAKEDEMRARAKVGVGGMN